MEPPQCTICLEAVVENNGRSIAQLMCGHIFHLDCIGSAFNVSRIMRCPNCRATENRPWETFGRGSPTNCLMVIDMNHYHFNLLMQQPSYYWNVIHGFTEVYTSGSMAFLQICDPYGGEWLLVAPGGFDLIPTSALPVIYDYLSWQNPMGAGGQAPYINRIHFDRQMGTPPTIFPNSTYAVGSTSNNINDVGGNINGGRPVDEQFTTPGDDLVANPTPWSSIAINSGSSAGGGGDSSSAAAYRPNSGSDYPSRDGGSGDGTSANRFNNWRGGSSSDQAPASSSHQDRFFF